MQRPSFTQLLAGTTVGVYLLLAVGATAALGDAAAVCGGWPLCAPADGLSAAYGIAVGHRILAALVGVGVLATLVMAFRRNVTRRVKLTVAVATLLYPLQIAGGALVATMGAPRALSGGHLLLAVGIFGALVAGLAWQLEHETGSDDRPVHDSPSVGPEISSMEPQDRVDVPTPGLLAIGGAYFDLMKPRLMWLLSLVAAAGMALAAGPALDLETVLFTLSGGVLAIGASGTFNHLLERDIDRRMNRTSDRPLATDLVSVRNALAFGVGLGGLSLLAFWQINLLAVGLGLTAIVFYSIVYTLILKPNTVQNTVLGGAAGALPALIGWVAVTGEIGVAGVALAAIVFLWTPAHFYNLALAYRDDYERGGFPMMPVVRGETVTRKHILYYLGATLIAAATLGVLPVLGWVYALTTVLFGAIFLYAVFRLHHEQTEGAAFRAFHASNAYLGMLLIAIVVDSLAI